MQKFSPKTGKVHHSFKLKKTRMRRQNHSFILSGILSPGQSAYNEGNQVKEMGKGWVQISFLFSHDLMMKDVYYSHN